MTPLNVTIVAAALVSFVTAWLVARNAVRLGLVQAPNERSSHVAPTPSGGGLGILAGGTLATAVAAWFAPAIMLPLLLTALGVGVLGFLDDRLQLPARIRLAAQLLLAAIAIALVIMPRGLEHATGLPLPDAVLFPLLVLAIVAWLNAFNFMDGIDGIAAGEAIFLLLAAAFLATLGPYDILARPLFWVLLGLAAASFGFLLLNWPPARIFMGDVGSTYLGFMLALLALLTVSEGWLSVPQWLILSAAFVADAAVTLLRRLIRGERVFEAHRRHAYQALARRWKSHGRATRAYLAVDLVWLLPLAMLASEPGWTAIAVALAYVPLLALALYFGAGAPEQSPAAR